MNDPRDRVDIRLGAAAVSPTPPPPAPGRGGAARPYLQLLFRCAGQYVRAYRNADGTGYLARCPRCGKAVRFRVGAGGTSERFFEVHC